MKICECGCGGEPKPGNRYINGHNGRGKKRPDTSERNKKWTGKNNPFYGKKHTKETKQKNSKANSGENHPFFGKKRPDISERMKGKNHPNWNPDRNVVYAPYTAKFYDKDYRQLIFETNNNGNKICPICRKNIIKELHHIDYNKQNDNKENLIFLCISCHRKTNYNRNHWKNKLATRRK